MGRDASWSHDYTMSTKSQVTIPKRVRNRLGLTPGDEIDFVVMNRPGFLGDSPVWNHAVSTVVLLA